jgi:heme exporter protein C
VDVPVNRNRLTFLAVAVGAVLTTVAFVMAFVYSAPVLANNTLTSGGGALIGGKLIANPVLFSQKIFYFHVPVAITSFVVFFFTAFYGARFLVTKDKRYDTRARIATEVTLLFVALTMITGDLWTRYEWGTWWVWEPRLTTYFIMMMLVIVYFVLRASIEDEERRAVYASAFGILAFLDAPLSFAITRIVPSGAHPVVLRAGGGLDAIQLSGFVIGLLGMLCVGYAIYQLRIREETVKERLEALKASLEG